MQHTSSLVVADTPFRIPVTSAEAFAHTRWQRARAALLAILARGGAVVLVGLPGSGKTLLLHDLADTLRHAGTSVRLIGRGDALDPALTSDVLLVDDAGFMDVDALAALCATGIPLVLAANPDAIDRLGRLRHLVMPVALDPLPLQDVARFVAARLSATGHPRDILEPEAVLALARHSGGLLRLVNVLGAAATFLARLEGSSRICLRHVEEAAAMHDGIGEDAEPAAPSKPEAVRAAPSRKRKAQALGASRPAGRQRRGVLGAVAVMLGLVLAGGWAFRERQAVPSKTQANEAGRQNDDHRAGGPRPAAGTRPLQAPSADGGLAVGISGNGPNARPPCPEPGRLPGGQATCLSVVDAPQQPATMKGGAKAVSQSADSASAPHQAIQASDTPVLFRGPIINETMGRLGWVTLAIRRQAVPSSIIVRFDASAGLLGSGELTGHLSEEGRITASGQLMMGSNPFICDLSGIISGDTLTGSARFLRGGSGYTARSRFTLARS